MNNITLFVPKDELSALAQIEGFISYAKSNYMGVIGLKSVDFDSLVWSVDLQFLGGKRAKMAHVKFTTHGTKSPRGPVEPSANILIQEPFLSFFKAVFLHRLVHSRTQALSDMLTVIKVLHHVVCQRLGERAHPSLFLRSDFIAADIVLEELAPESAYRRAVGLSVLLDLMNDNFLFAKPVSWKNQRDKPIEMRLDISDESEKRRVEKMPSMKAVISLIQMAMWALDGELYMKIPVDLTENEEWSFDRKREYCDEKDGPVILGMALGALGLNCRITELALMPFNAESFTLAKGELDSDGIAEDEDRFALRWKPVKGGAPMVKPFSRELAGFAKLIVGKLKRLSEQPRRVAKHYECNPSVLYLPSELEYIRKCTWLTEMDASKLVGIDVGSLDVWCERNSVRRKRGGFGEGGEEVLYEFSSLENALLEKLPKGFPYVFGGVKYSDLMFCCFYNQTHAGRGTCKLIPSRFRQDTFEHVLTERKTVEAHCSVFEKYGFYEDDGAKIDVTTHEFRHFWQSQLKKAGVSELIAAYAAGRADIKHNEAYDLQKPREVAGMSFDIIDKSKESLFELSALAIAHEVLGGVIDRESSGRSVVVSFSKNAIVTFDGDSGVLNFQGCHLTDFGVCRHNYISSGCQKFMDCIDCDELLCIKGVVQFEENAIRKAEELRSRLSEYQKQVAEDVVDGVKGADQWLEKTIRQLEKLDRLIGDVYLNKSVKKGSIAQLSAGQKDTSSFAQALIEKLGLILNRQSGRGRKSLGSLGG